MYIPGDQLRVDEAYIDQRGRIELRSGNANLSLAGPCRNVQKELENIEVGSTATFTRRNEHGTLLAMTQGYLPGLISTFYHQPSSAALRQQRLATASENLRWTSCRLVNDPVVNGVHPPQYPLCWAEVRNDNPEGQRWVMPGSASIFSEHPQGLDISFSAQQHGNAGRYFPGAEQFLDPDYCCYRPLAGFPYHYSAKIEGQDRRLRIVLHGFLQPTTAHYKILKHPYRDCHIRNYWQHYLGELGDETDFFRACQNRDNHPEPCPTCDPGRFKVTDQLLQTVLTKYLDYIARFLIKADNVQLICAGPDINTNGSYCKVMLNALWHDRKVQPSQFFIRFVNRGVCYNWNADTPVVHLQTKTLFAKLGRFNLWGDADRKWLNANHDNGNSIKTVSLTNFMLGENDN